MGDTIYRGGAPQCLLLGGDSCVGVGKAYLGVVGVTRGGGLITTGGLQWKCKGGGRR